MTLPQRPQQPDVSTYSYKRMVDEMKEFLSSAVKIRMYDDGSLTYWGHCTLLSHHPVRAAPAASTPPLELREILQESCEAVCE